MATVVGQIHWVGKNSGDKQDGDVTRAVYLLSEDGGEVVQVTITCDYNNSHRYDIKLRKVSENYFEGAYQKYQIGSQQLVRNGAVTCRMLNSTETHGLLLGTSAWVDDNEWKWDWIAKLDSIERIPFEEWHS